MSLNAACGTDGYAKKRIEAHGIAKAMPKGNQKWDSKESRQCTIYQRLICLSIVNRMIFSPKGR